MKKRQCRCLIGVTGIVLCLAGTVSAGTIFTIIPSDGNVSGPPGSVVGWGYSLTNNDTSDWFVSTALNSDSFSNGTPTLLFDFPIIAPGDTVTESFDAVNGIGLFELAWDDSAPAGFVNSGNFVLSGQSWTGDPFSGGSFIADVPDTALPYTATVGGAPPSEVPEPSSFVLLVGGTALMIAFRMAPRLLGCFASR